MARLSACLLLTGLALSAGAADVESRVLTHYVPQDALEAAVRNQGWTPIALDVKGGVRKGDVVRIWTGGSIDRGNGDFPGQYVGGPSGPLGKLPPFDAKELALRLEQDLAGRGHYVWLDTTPNVALFRLVCGPPNTTRLNTLNASARKSRRSCSRIGKLLASETFSVKFGN